MHIFSHRFLFIVVMLYGVSGCASNAPDTFNIQSEIAKKTNGANCAKLRTVMVEAKKAHQQSKDMQAAGDTALVAGMALSVIPGVGLLAPVLSGAGIAGQTNGTYGKVKPELLYQESHRVYHRKGCKPKIQFGK